MQEYKKVNVNIKEFNKNKNAINKWGKDKREIWIDLNIKLKDDLFSNIVNVCMWSEYNSIGILSYWYNNRGSSSWSRAHARSS